MPGGPIDGMATALRGFGVSTVYEAAGQQGLIDVPLIQLVPGSRAAGPARTVLCGQDDNLMVHAVMEQAQAGEVLVLTMPAARPVSLIGELLAVQAHARGVAGLLVDAAVRDADDLVRLGLPIWSRFVRATGAAKKTIGAIGEPVTVGGARIEQANAAALAPAAPGGCQPPGWGRWWRLPRPGQSASPPFASSCGQVSSPTTCTTSGGWWKADHRRKARFRKSDLCALTELLPPPASVSTSEGRSPTSCCWSKTRSRPSQRR